MAIEGWQDGLGFGDEWEVVQTVQLRRGDGAEFRVEVLKSGEATARFKGSVLSRATITDAGKRARTMWVQSEMTAPEGTHESAEKALNETLKHMKREQR